MYSIRKLLFLLLLLVILCNSYSAYASDYVKYYYVTLQILNKITGKVKIFNANLNQIYNADADLSFIVKACYKTSQKYDPEDVMFIQVARSEFYNEDTLKNNNNILLNANQYVNDLVNIDNNVNDDEQNKDNKMSNYQSKLIFSGWMFSTAPEISSLIDNTYDISIIRCTN